MIDPFQGRRRELQALIDKFVEEREARGEPFLEIRELVGSICQYHPLLRALPDDMAKLYKAYELAMRTFPSEADSKALLGDTLTRRRSNGTS